MSRPGRKLPDPDLTEPRMYGPKKLPKLPMELIIAMPAGAVLPLNMVLGRVVRAVGAHGAPRIVREGPGVKERCPRPRPRSGNLETGVFGESFRLETQSNQH